MPNHWESSARPLFVKTVYVNGNRHAVLFEKDPLLRCGNSPFKKTSRPGSSLSFRSDLSISSTKSEECKPANPKQRQSKDLTAELQSCLVKLKLASANKKKPKEEELSCSKEPERSEGEGSSKRKRQNREKRKQCEREESKARKSGRKSCYVYNLESYKGKKNYCFVKISSQPPELILDCCCCDSTTEHTCDQTNKNMVISATIHNLVMTPDGRGRVFPLENAELYWNNHVTRSYYNSLSERVLQWLDLTKRRKKQKDKENATAEDETATERIFSGKRFADEIKKVESSYKSDNRMGGKLPRQDTFESDVEGEVTGEPNVETLLSTDFESESSSAKTDFSYPLAVGSKASTGRLNVPSGSRSYLKIEDLFVNCDRKKRESGHKSRKGNGGGDDVIITLNNWTGDVSKTNALAGDKQQRCHCNRNLPERNQKSINNPNNTRARPVLIQNFLSPQQPDKMSYLQEEKIVWASEKNTGRPQLHIFMPSIVLKDSSDDSDCENHLT